MSEDINSDSKKLNPNHSNSKLIYEYTESYLRFFDKGLDSIKQKATTVLGFTPIVLKFASDLADDNSFLIITKIGVCLLLAINIVICIVVLNPGKEGDVVKPTELIDDWFYEEADITMLFISRQWIEASKQLDELYDKKAKLLVHSYSCIGISAILFAVNIILDTVCKRY